MAIKPVTAPICKQLEEMNEEELATERKREWTVCRSSDGFWLRVDDAPFRYFPDHSSEDALRECTEHAKKFSINIGTFIFY